MSKYTAENYIRFFSKSSHLKYTIFRYGNVFGPRQNPLGEAGVVSIFTGQMLNGIRPVIYGDGNKTRDYVFVNDIVMANLNVLDVILIVNIALGNSDFDLNGDMNSDGGINILDVVLLVNIILGI